MITGGAAGLGEATVRLFVRNGARVVIVDIDDEAGERLMTELGDASATSARRAMSLPLYRTLCPPSVNWTSISATLAFSVLIPYLSLDSRLSLSSLSLSLSTLCACLSLMTRA